MTTTNVTAGQTSTGLSITSGDTLNVLSGGKVIDTTVSNGGYEYVSSGGVASDSIVSGGTEFVYSSGTAIGTTVINGGDEYVFNGGMASGTSVRSGGTEILSSGTADSATVFSGGNQNIDGGMANYTTVSAGGTQNLYSGMAAYTVLSGGGVENVFGGTAMSTTVANGGGQNVDVGGTASATTVLSGGNQHVFGGRVTGTILSGGTEVVFSGGTASGTVADNGGSEYIYKQATASGSVVNSGGFMAVSGTASATHVNNGGYENVSGTVVSTVVAGGEEYVRSGGSASFTVVSAGYQYVCSSGTASGTVVSGGDQYVSGTAFATIVSSGGTEYVFSGGTASGATVDNGGTLIVNVGGHAFGVTVNSGGTVQMPTVIVSSAQTSGGLLVGDGDTVTVLSGGTAVGTTISSGGLEVVSSGGTADGFVISAGGSAELLAGALTSGDLTLTGSGAWLEIGGTIMPSAAISDFPALSTIDLASEAYSAGGQATLESGNVLHITGIGIGAINLQLDPSQNFADTSFTLASDGDGGTDLTTTTTYTWTGAISTDGSVPGNWSPAGPPGDGDTVVVPAGSTIDSSGGSIADATFLASGPSTTITNSDQTDIDNTATVGSGVVWNFIGSPVTSNGTITTGSTITGDTDTFATGDTLSLTDTMVNDADFSFATGDTLDLTGSVFGSMEIDENNHGMGSQFKQTGTDATLTINSYGTVSGNGWLWVQNGGTVNVDVQNGATTASGVYESGGPVLVTGGTLVVNSAGTNDSFANANFLLDYGGSQASHVTINARMDSAGGVMDMLGGTNGTTLELNTGVSGSQMLVFGDGNATMRIDATDTLSYSGNTMVLANMKGRILDFQPSDTIDLAGLAAGSNGLTYSYGEVSTYGPGVLELMNNGTLVGVLRFVGSQFADGTGTLSNSGSFSGGDGSFVLASDSNGGTMITLEASATNEVATWTGGTSGDWSGAALWSGDALPGEYQTADFTMSAAEANDVEGGTMPAYTVTVSSAETAGSVTFSDPFAMLQIGAALTLMTEAGESGGGSFQVTNGTVDIGAGGTVSATNFDAAGAGGELDMTAGGLLVLSGTPAFSAGIGLLGLDVESYGSVTDGTIDSSGATFIGEKSPGSMYVGTGSGITDTYTMIGGSTFADSTVNPSSLTIDGPNTQYTDAGGDGSTEYSGAMLVGGGYTGVSSTLTAGNYVTSVPNGGNGTLSVDDGATLTEASYAILGVTQTSVGTAMVGNGAQWLINEGTDATAPPNGLVVGTTTIYSPGTAGSTIPVFTVGMQGSGTLDINSAGTVQLGTIESFNTLKMVIGQGGSTNASAHGLVSVSGPDSLLDTGGGPLAIGNRASGVLNVNDGGTVLAGNGGSTTGISYGMVLGNKNAVVSGSTIASSGSLTVGGDGTNDSLVTVQTGNMVIGRAGSGLAVINSGGGLSVAEGTIYLGGAGPSDSSAGGPGGTLDVYGGRVEAAGLWIVNNENAGAASSIDIENSGTVSLEASSSLSAAFNLSSGNAQIGGNGLLSLDDTGTADIANAALTIDNGGTMAFAGYSGIGYQLVIGGGSLSGTSSIVTVQSNGLLDVAGPVSIGQTSGGTLTVGSNSSVNDASASSGEPWSVVVGNAAAGTLDVTGGSAQDIASGAMAVGLDSYGDLLVEQGGYVTVGGELDVGGSPLGGTLAVNGTGQVTIDGSGSQLSVGGDIVVGDTGTLTGFSGVTVSDGGSLDATGTLYLGSRMQSGTLVANTESGSLFLNSDATAQFGGLALWTGSNVSMDSSSELILGYNDVPAGAPGDILIGSDGVLSGGGTIGTLGTIIDNGLIESTAPGSSNRLDILGNIGGSGTLSIAAGTTLEVGVVASTDTVVFSAGSPNSLVMTIGALPFAMHAEIEHFSVGNTIDLTGQTGLTLKWNQASSAGGVLTVTQGIGGSVVASLDISGTQTGFALQGDGSGGTDIVAATQLILAASPVATNSQVAVLGTIGPDFGSDALSVTLESDAGFASGVSKLVLNDGSLVYTPGVITDANAGADSINYSVTDTVTGMSIEETQTVTLDVSAGSGPYTFAWNAGSGAWSTAANWTNLTSSTAGPPGSADTAEFESGGGTISGPGEAGTLDLLGGTWTMDGDVDVADDTAVGVGASAALFIDAGGTVDSSGAAAIAASAGSDGSSVSVIGANSTWQVTGALDIGEAAEGSLSVVSQGTVTASAIDAGVSADGSGVITVSGVGSDITVGGQMTLGDAGVADMLIVNGATVTATNADLGVQGTGSGEIDVEGNSLLQINGTLDVGDQGNAVLSVDVGATVNANNYNLGAYGLSYVDGGSFNVIDPTLSSTQSVSRGGSFTVAGVLTIDSTGIITVSSGFGYINLGTITGDSTTGGGGDLNVGHLGDFVLADGTGGASGPVLGVGPLPDITFTDTTGTLTVKDAAVLGTLEIGSFNSGDVIDLPNLVFTGTTIVTSGTVDLVNAGGTIVGDVLYNPTTVTGSLLTAPGAIVGEAPCFAAGTRIATTRGGVAVEQLRVGDEVCLARGGTAPVVWLGHRRVGCARHPRPRDVMPVRVMADAFGPGQPGADVMLSPDHAVFIDGVLIPVRYLLNGATVVQEAASEVTYWHVELDHHEVLLADGLACESYLDTGNRGAFANGGGATMMQPDFALRVWERESCAELVTAGAELEAARSWLLERAEVLGFTVTADPDLHLLAGGEALWPEAVAGGVYRFTLPAGAAAVVIASRSAVPGEMADVYDDGRRLGVMLGGITFRQGGVACEVALAGLPDDAGFHALEGDDRWYWRWTDGRARLAVPAGFAPDAPLTLELHVAASRPAWVAPAVGVERVAAAA